MIKNCEWEPDGESFICSVCDYRVKDSGIRKNCHGPNPEEQVRTKGTIAKTAKRTKGKKPCGGCSKGGPQKVRR